MCLAIPAKIVEKDGEKGLVNLGGGSQNRRLGNNAYWICSEYHL